MSASAGKVSLSSCSSQYDVVSDSWMFFWLFDTPSGPYNAATAVPLAELAQMKPDEIKSELRALNERVWDSLIKQLRVDVWPGYEGKYREQADEA